MAKKWQRNRFGKNKIFHRPDFPWPAQSPDFASGFSSFWGYVQEKNFEAKRDIFNAIKEAVREGIAHLHQNVLTDVIQNFQKKSKSLFSAATGWPFLTFIIEYHSLSKT